MAKLAVDGIVSDLTLSAAVGTQLGLISSGETVLPIGGCRNASSIAPSSLFPNRHLSPSNEICTGILVISAFSRLSLLLFIFYHYYYLSFALTQKTHMHNDQPQAGLSPASSSALCREQMWVSSGAPSLPPTPSPCAPVGPHGLERVLPARPSLSSSHPVSPSLSSSLPFSLPLYLVCVFKTQHKSSYSSLGCDPNGKECLYAGRLPFLCINIAHTQAHALTHSVSGASAGCWPRDPSQSKGIWALLEKAGKEEGKKKYKSKKDLERSSSSSLCPCARCG